MIQSAAHALSTAHRLPGLVMIDHQFEVPLDYAEPNGAKISVFAREVVSPSKEHDKTLPWMVFFQGGPGFPSPRPLNSSGWLGRALKDYRVLLLDQRGTGRSSPITFQTLARLSDPNAQAKYLTHFRADSIVRDSEFIRTTLLGKNQKWTGFGQSYGGFCLTRYLTFAPEGLEAAIITGGLPPLSANVDDIYRATYKRSVAKNQRYYRRYPDDVERVREVIRYLREHEVSLPAGGLLTPERFQQLGLVFGMSDGFELVHYKLEEAFVDAQSGRELSYTFLREVEYSQTFESNPIYAFLHEAIYCQNDASNWSAQRVRKEFPEFAIDRIDDPVYFTGEMIYPWMFDVYPGLKALKEVAEILAMKENWPVLYDRKTLGNNKVPVVAAIYYDDMYVETSYSEDTANSIANTRTWVTNEFEHNGIRADGDRVLSHLLSMLKGEV